MEHRAEYQLPTKAHCSVQQRRRQGLHRPLLQANVPELKAQVPESAREQLADLGGQHELRRWQHRLH